MRFNRSILLGVLCAASLGAIASSNEGLHTDWLDKSVDPGKDFFSYANGGWQKANPIPAAYSRWGTFNVLNKQNQDVIHDILEDLAKDKKLKAGSTDQKVGDFYASGMDEQAIETAGITPLQPELDRIAAIKDSAGLQAEIAHLQMIGVDAVFNFGQMQDFKDSSKVIGAAFQGGLGLPDRDYYLKTADKCQAPAATTAAAAASANQAAQAQYTACKSQADKFQKVRDAYVTHVTNSFKLLGDAPDKAAAEAATVMGIEKGLAQASMARVDMRIPEHIYHPMDVKALDGATPGFSWQGYFTAVGHPEIQAINLATPDFFKAASDDDLEGLPGRLEDLSALAHRGCLRALPVQSLRGRGFRHALRAHRRQGAAAPLAARGDHRGRCHGLRHRQALRGQEVPALLQEGGRRHPGTASAAP